MPDNGFLHPKKIIYNVHVTAKNSPSVGKYQVLANDVNRDPGNNNLQPSGQHVGIWSNVQSHCVFKSK